MFSDEEREASQLGSTPAASPEGGGSESLVSPAIVEWERPLLCPDTDVLSNMKYWMAWEGTRRAEGGQNGATDVKSGKERVCSEGREGRWYWRSFLF